MAFFISTNAFASVLYTQTDDTGTISGSYDFHTGGFTADTVPYTSFTNPITDGANFDIRFKVKVTGNNVLSDANITISCNSNDIARYSFSSSDLTSLASGTYVEFATTTNSVYNNASTYCPSHNVVFKFNSDATNPLSGNTLVDLKADSANTHIFTTLASAGTLPPDGDGNTTTHVIAITTPTLYATTTTPTTLKFSIYNNSTNQAQGYVVEYQNINTFADTKQYGWLVDSGFSVPVDLNVPYLVSTTTPSLPGGQYKVSVTLTSGNATELAPTPTNPSGFFNPATVSYFGVGSSGSFILTPTFTSTSFGYASTSCAISFSGGFSLSDCLGYIFLPSQNAFTSYTSLPTQLSSKFPFSYISSMQGTWSSLAASSTENAPVYNFNFHDVGIGSTTALGNVLPNTQAFGASTTEAYFPAGTFNTLKALIAAIVWLSFGVDAFFTVRNMITV